MNEWLSDAHEFADLQRVSTSVPLAVPVQCVESMTDVVTVQTRARVVKRGEESEH